MTTKKSFTHRKKKKSMHKLKLHLIAAKTRSSGKTQQSNLNNNLFKTEKK